MINKFLPNDGERPFHSSAYAKVAHGDALGAVSSQSFAERHRIDRNRQAIGGYRHSLVGKAYGAERARSVASSAETQRAQLGTPLARPSSRPQTFREPPARGYNPYK
jgi:hypothetical protein